MRARGRTCSVCVGVYVAMGVCFLNKIKTMQHSYNVTLELKQVKRGKGARHCPPHLAREMADNQSHGVINNLIII